MVRKAKRSASQWDSGMPMVPLKPRESGDVWMIFLVFRLLVYFSVSKSDCLCRLFSYSLQTQCPQIFVRSVPG